MADAIRISQLDPASSLSGNEPIPVVQSSATKRTTPSAILSYGTSNNILQSYSAQLAGLSSLSNFTTGPVIQGSAGTFYNAIESSYSGTAFNNATQGVKWGDIWGFTNSGTITASLDGAGLGAGFYFYIVCQSGATINFAGVNGSSIFGINTVTAGTTNSTLTVIKCFMKHIGEWFIVQQTNVPNIFNSYFATNLSSNVDLTNTNNFPICPTFISVSFTTGTNKIILPATNASNAVPKGKVIRIRNTGVVGHEFSIFAQDGTSIIASLAVNDYVELTLSDASTTNGSWDVKTLNTMAGQSSSSVFITGGTIYGALIPPNAQTGTTYTLDATDCGKVVTFNNASAITVTVPSMSQGFMCKCYQKGAGQVTFTGGSGVTLNSANSALKTRVQYSPASIYFDASNTAFVDGDLTQ